MAWKNCSSKCITCKSLNLITASLLILFCPVLCNSSFKSSKNCQWKSKFYVRLSRKPCSLNTAYIQPTPAKFQAKLNQTSQNSLINKDIMKQYLHETKKLNIFVLLLISWIKIGSFIKCIQKVVRNLPTGGYCMNCVED